MIVTALFSESPGPLHLYLDKPGGGNTRRNDSCSRKNYRPSHLRVGTGGLGGVWRDNISGLSEL